MCNYEKNASWMQNLLFCCEISHSYIVFKKLRSFRFYHENSFSEKLLNQIAEYHPYLSCLFRYIGVVDIPLGTIFKKFRVMFDQGLKRQSRKSRRNSLTFAKLA